MTDAIATYSLRTKMLLMLLVSMLAVMACVGVLGYKLAMQEADEIFDAQLAEMAQLMLRERFSPADKAAPELKLSAHTYQQKMAYQLWRGDQRLLKSDNAPNTPMAVEPGYSYGQLGQVRWRFFVAKHPDQALVAITAQDSIMRDECAEELAWRMAGPIAAGILILSLITWLVVARACRPVTAIARQVNARTADRLAPVALKYAAPRELLPLLDAVNALFKRVELSLESERRFTADAAHELRTPLAAMCLQAQLAEEATTADQRRTATATLLNDASRTSHLVEQLLTLARADNLSRRPISSIVNVAREAVDVVIGLQPMAHAKAQTLTVDAPRPVLLSADTELLRAMISNLATNAIKYSPQGAKIVIQVSPASITVMDNGPGMREEERARAIQRFVRLHDDDRSGSGLGLSIVERVAHALFMTLEFEDTPGGGLTVRCRFQRSAAADFVQSA
jgi:two-component system, OmpR family, sensor histidine kinase QseC